MCLAIPGKIISLSKGKATISYSGEERQASTSLADVDIGDYVICQAGFIIQKIPEKEAIEAIKLWRETMIK